MRLRCKTLKSGVMLGTFLSLLIVCLVQHSDTYLENASSTRQLKLSAFNIENLGLTKMGKPEVVRRLVQILLRYDLVFIQGVRDGSAMAALLATVNRMSSDSFKLELSNQPGKRDHRELYAYLYRSSKLSLVSTFQYPESLDQFERPPFCVRFKTNGISDIREIGFIGVHVSLVHSQEEIDHLVDVYDLLRKKWHLDDFVIGGNLNADCKYVSGSKWLNIRLRMDPRFRWLITDDIDTTVYHSGCTLDRLILAGDGILHSYVSETADAYRFDDNMDLTYDEARAVSDHVPVELILR